MTNLVIKVAEDYSATPLGRYRKHGEFSGQRFREDFLIPAIEKYENITIDFDGVAGLPSSFLEEAFGGLVRTGNVTAKEFFARVVIMATNPSLTLAKDRVRRYVSAAEVSTFG